MNPGYGPGGGGGGGGNMDGFWMYLYMRDIMWLSYWDDLERRRVYLNGDIYNNANVVTGVPVKPSSGKEEEEEEEEEETTTTIMATVTTTTIIVIFRTRKCIAGR